MRAVVQRTLTSSVTSEGVETGRAGLGLTVLLGVAQDDDEKDALYMAEKISNLRIFEDDKGKMNRSLVDIGGDARRVAIHPVRRRPPWTQAQLYRSSATGIGRSIV